MVDLFVVGGGPSGISCAVEAKRLGFSVLLAEKENIGGTIKYARKIENFPPFTGVSGKELSQKFADFFSESHIEYIPIEVIEINFQNETFLAMLQNGRKVEAKSVYLATGQEDFIPSEYSSFAHLIKTPKCILDSKIHSKEILIYGGGDVAFDVALSLADLQCYLTVACRSKIKAKDLLQKEAEVKGIEILENFFVQNIQEKGNKKKVVLKKRKKSIELLCDEVVFAVGKKPSLPEINLPFNFKEFTTSTIRKLNKIGIFCGGDLIRGRNRNVGIAVGDGIAAAFNINLFLKGKGK